MLLSAYVSPDSFPVLLSIKFLVGSVVGGIVSISGVFIGALFIEFTPNFADQISKAAPDAIFGMLLIALMYLMPKGAIGVLSFLKVRPRQFTVAKNARHDPQKSGARLRLRAWRRKFSSFLLLMGKKKPASTSKVVALSRAHDRHSYAAMVHANGLRLARG